ncbi:MAG: hypothetical protein J6A75_06870 [Lachnospiraceae bacterium]|nr:hypothetical protein [Lachnospiraceae bacterium]
MSQVFKTFMGVFFILILLLTGVGIISAQMDVSAALNYKTDVVTELENSNYNAEVINACITQAKDKGYEIKIRTFVSGGASTVYVSPNVSDTTDVVMAEVVLTYPYKMFFLETALKREVRGYAR